MIWFHQDPKLIAIARTYFHIIAMATIPALTSMVLLQFFIGISRSAVNMRFSVLSAPLIVFGAYVFIFGKFGMPQMGLAGVAMANVIVAWTMLCVVIGYIKFSPSCRHLSLLSGPPRICRNEIKRILQIGVPIGVQFGGELAAMTTVTYFMGWLGTVALAAQQIVVQFTMVIAVASIGISQACSVLISQALGRNDCQVMRQIGRAGIALTTSLMCMAALSYTLFPRFFIHWFIDVNAVGNAAIVALASILFPIAGLLQIADSMRNTMSGALRGLHDSVTPMFVSIICLWGLSVPLSYVVGIRYGYGPVGLRLGFLLGFIVCGLILFWRFFSKVDQLGSIQASGTIH